MIVSYRASAGMTSIDVPQVVAVRVPAMKKAPLNPHCVLEYMSLGVISL